VIDYESGILRIDLDFYGGATLLGVAAKTVLQEELGRDKAVELIHKIMDVADAEFDNAMERGLQEYRGSVADDPMAALKVSGREES
jgi:hypothetical protein